MLLLEHEGKALLRRHGIATPVGTLVRDEAALLAAIGDGGKVLKAQVAAGGRGKAGGIRFASDAAEALAAYRDLRRQSIAGQTVELVLVEDRIAYERERYAGIQIENGRLTLLFAARGGVDIEDITAGDAANVRAIAIDVVAGPDRTAIQQALAELDMPRSLRSAYEAVARRLFSLARACDATTVEINPLAETGDGRLIALDARVYLDEAALARHPGLAPPPSAAGVDAAVTPKFKANPGGGSIGLVGLGSGLNITLMDWIADGGGRVGTLVDIDAMLAIGQGEAGFAAALAHMEAQADIRAILICIISCGHRMDDIVRALLAALDRRPSNAKPVILHLRGHRMAQAEALISRAGLRNSRSLGEAVADVIAAGREATS